MKIAFWVHDCRREVGHGRYVVELASRFQHEHDVHVFSNTFSSDGLERVRWHRVPAVRKGALSTIGSFAAAASLTPVRGFDVVHGQGQCHPKANVVTAHICNAGWFAAQEGATGWGAAKLGLFDRVVTPLERWAFQAEPRKEIIAISAKVADELRHHYGVTQPIHVIHHGVDGARFHARLREVERDEVRAELAVTPGEILFLFVGDLRKGAQTVLEALAATPSGVLGLVSGTPPERWRREARRLGVAGRVRFVPATQRIERYYAAADVFVFPTPYDAFGMVISEAMSSGLPVITTSAAGASELLEDRVSGWLVPPREVGALVRAMEALAKDDALRKSMGRWARERMSTLSWDSVAEQTLAVYRRAVRGAE